MRRHAALRAIIAVLALGLAGGASAEPGKDLRRFHSKVDIQAAGERSIFAAGAKVGIRGTVDKDIWAAGADVDIEAEVGDDVAVYASSGRVVGTVAGDVDIAAVEIAVDAAIGDDLIARGVDIAVGKAGVIAGDAHLFAADTVTYGGSAGGKVEIRGKDVTFAGIAKGPVELTGTRVAIAPGARIDGTLTIYSIGEPEISPEAVIAGNVAKLSLYESPNMRDAARRWIPGDLMLALLVGASALIAGLALLLIGRESVEDVIDSLIERPGTSLAAGLGALVVIPLVAAVLGFTVVGIPLGVGLLLILPLLLLLGLSGAGYGAGEWLLNRAGEPRSGGARTLMLLLGLVVLMALAMIPYAGPAIAGLAAILGAGALLRTLSRRLGATGYRPAP